MPRQPLYRIEVEGLAEALRLPEQLERARLIFPRRLAVELAHDMQERTRGHIAHEDVIEGRVLTDSTVVVGTVGSKSARALQEGAAIVARKGRTGRGGRRAALRFVIDGRTIFARRIVIMRNRPGGKPFTRALRNRNAVTERVWKEVMDGADPV